MSATIPQLQAWIRDYQRDFNGLCQALMWQTCAKFGTASAVYTNATNARRASGNLNKDIAAAPAGSFHYWDGIADGHVALGLGGESVFMASKHVLEQWGINAGRTTVSDYSRRTGLRYLGWSNTNGRNDVVILLEESEKDRIKRIARYLNSRVLGIDTTAELDGVRGPAYWTCVQRAGHIDGLYPTPPYIVDGDPGPKTYELEKHYSEVAR